MFLLPKTSPARDSGEFEPGDVIVHWSAAAKRRTLSRVAGRRIHESRVLGDRATLLRLATRSRRATTEALSALAADPRVARVEPNYIRRPFRVPNDTHYVLQWNIKAARLEQAWDQRTGNPSVVVAVVDTGILMGHPDLAGRLVKGFDFVSDPANAGDKDGWDGDPKDEGTDSLTSSAFHGTHVAGVIGAMSNNNKGIVGVDWGCKIQPVRALGIQEGKGRDADIAAAIRWAAGVPVPNAPQNPTPARVINLSFGGPGASYLLSDAIKDAQNKGAIVVAAAGNHGGSVTNIYPAVIPDVVTVGATQIDGKRAPYSNYGNEVDIMAPGGNMTQKLPFKYQNKEWYAGILGTLFSTKSNKFTYHLFEGTSQSAPLVAGVVSLMLGINPTLNSGETINILKKSANPASKCNEGCGAGLIDANNALTVTTGGGGGGPGGQKLPFSYQCSDDSQCSGNMCRMVSNRMICTQPCPCPQGASCTAGGLCDPLNGSGSYGPGNPSAGQPGPGGMIYGSGCAVGGGGYAAYGAGLLLLLALGLIGLRLRRPG